MLWVNWFSVNQLLCLTLNVKNGNQWAKSKVCYSMQKKTTERNLCFFPVLVERECLLHVAHFFFNLLLNHSMLDFVLDSVKRSRVAGAIVTIENEREYARTRRHVSDRELKQRLQVRGPMKFISSSELACYYSKTACYHSNECYADHRNLTENTAATIRPPSKRFNKQTNSCARAL